MIHESFVRPCSDLERGSTMRSETRLDFAVFQLTPTRTRCELLVSAGGVTEKLASGLLKPFLAHLKAAEEEIERGGYSIKLVPFFADSSDGHGAAWFTKDTIERFVRFVSTPEVLERVSSVEAELVQIEEAISVQANEARVLQVDEQYLRTSPATSLQGGFTIERVNNEKGSFSTKSRRNSVDSTDIAGGDSSKWRLLRAMDARRLMLQKEQGMAFARAAAAGFDINHMENLIAFADCFGATRLREACVKFMALCKKRQEAGLWIEEMEMVASESAANRSEGVEYVEGLRNLSRGKEYNDTWWDVNSEAGDESRDDFSMKSFSSFYRDGRFILSEEDLKRRRSSQEDNSGNILGEYGPAGGYRPRGRHSQNGGLAPFSIDDLQASACRHDMLGRSYSLCPGSNPGSKVPTDLSVQRDHGYEYRDVNPQGARDGMANQSLKYMHVNTQGSRDGVANQSLKYMQGYHGISPSTSPASGLPSWIPPEEEKNYDSRSHYSQQSGRGNMHGAVPYGHHGHFSAPGLHSGHADGGYNSQWRQGEYNGIWASQQPPPPPQFLQGSGGYEDESLAQHYGDSLRAPESPYISVSPAHQRVSNSSDLRSLCNSQGVQSAPASKPFVKPQSPAREELEVVQTEVQQPTPDAPFLHTPVAPKQCSEEKGGTSTGTVDESSPSFGGKQAQSHIDSVNRQLVRRSTSPRRRSSSPLRKVQVGRSGARRSGLVVIRNINYITSSSQDRGALARDRESDESAVSDSDGAEDQLQEKSEQVHFSVKDAINLFEKKRKDSGNAVKKSSRRGSAGSESSSFNERVKQWSEASDASAVRVKEGSLNEDSDVHSKQGSCTVDQEVRGDRSITHPSKSEEDEVESRPTRHVEQDQRHAVALFGLLSGQRGRNSSRSLPQFDPEVSSYHQSTQVEKVDLPGGEIILLGKDEKRIQEKSSAQYTVDEVNKQGTYVIETKGDDSFMVPHRDRQKERGPWALGPESEMMRAEVKDTVQDDSFMLPARGQVQCSSWKTGGNMEESEISADQNKPGVAAVDTSSFAEDLMYIPDRNTGRDSVGSQWNTQLEYEMEFYKHVGEDNEKSVVGENGSPKDQQGRFYEQYREKRDAKLREQPGPKRAEREAKLKAMQAVLEKQKAEMASKTGGRTSEVTKYAATVDAQLRAEKVRQFKAGLLESKRKKEEEERKRIDEIRMQRRERIAAKSSPTVAASGSHSASSTPRASRQSPITPKANSRLSPSKNLKVGAVVVATRATVLSSPKAIPGKTAMAGAAAGPPHVQKVSTQAAATVAENLLSRSVFLVDLRKENAKLTGRSSLGDRVGGSARIQAKMISSMHRSKSGNDASSLESNVSLSSSSVARATVLSDDKKRRSVSSRSGISTVTELKIAMNSSLTEPVPTPTRSTKGTTCESAATKIGKRTFTTAGAQDAKPFLRKGTGIGPGSGAVVRKLKPSQMSDSTKSMDEHVPNAPSVATADCVVSDREIVKNEAISKTANSAVAAASVVSSDATDFIVQSSSKEPRDETRRAGNSPGLIAIRASPSQAREASDNTVKGADVIALTASPHSTINKETAIRETGQEANTGLWEVTEEVKTVNDTKAEGVLGSPIYALVAPFVDQGQSGVAFPGPLSPSGSKVTALSLVSIPPDYSRQCALASPSPVIMAPNTEDYDFVLKSPSDTLVLDGYEPPIAVETLSATASLVSQTFLQPQRSVSPDPSVIDRSNLKKKGRSQKCRSAQQGSKDASRGFKRLLNFGRRSSKGNMVNSNEWVSASTTSEGDDDVDETKVGGNQLSDIPNKLDSCIKNARSRSTSNDKDKNNLRYMGDSPESGRTESNGSGDRSFASRSSFFSLTSFRSKNDSKYRA